MIRIFKYYWITTKGYRFCPWRSPYVKWRIQTAFGVDKDKIDFCVFWKLMFIYRKPLWHFCKWVVTMQKLSERGSPKYDND